MAHRHNVDPDSPRTLTANATLTAAEIAESTIFTFDPGGSARTVTIPAASSTNAGTMLVIGNLADAAEVITVSDGTNTLGTPTQSEAMMVFSDGTEWVGIVGASS